MSVNPAFEPDEGAGPKDQTRSPTGDPTFGLGNTDFGTTECGIGPFRPRFLRKFRSPKWLLFCLCWASAVQGMAVNGFVNVVITSIERRFGLSSKASGMVASGYDMGSLLGLLPTAYLGGRPSASKPRWLGAGITILSIGSLVFALPHLVFGTYGAGNSHNGLRNVTTCNPNATSSINDYSNCNEEEKNGLGGVLSWSLVFFMTGQALHGLGAAPFYTLGVAFLDESVDTAHSALYTGIFYTMAILGPACGYMLGNVFLKVYVDVGQVDPISLGLTPESSLWVGAWWMGFVLSGFLGLLIAIPLLAFPPSFPGAAQIHAAKVSEVHQRAKKQQEQPSGSEGDEMGRGLSLDSLAQIPKATRSLLLHNPPFVFLSLAGGMDALLISGLAAFLPKYLESQFTMSQAFAGFLVGVVTVPGGGGGTFLGGYIIKKMRMRCGEMIRTCACSAFVAFLLVFVFLAYCPDIPTAGITANYTPQPDSATDKTEKLELESWCNSDCKCSPSNYDPICGADKLLYYSPCYAGCTFGDNFESITMYGHCRCVMGHVLRNVTVEGQLVPISASRENCASQCTLLPLYLTALLLCMLATFLTSIPSLSATLRCVKNEERSLSLGIQWVVLRIFGSIPGPMIFGAVIDRTCNLWQIECGETGNCQSYSNFLLSRYILILVTCGKGVTLLFFFLAWKMYKPPKNAVQPAQQPATNGVTQETAFK